MDTNCYFYELGEFLYNLFFLVTMLQTNKIPCIPRKIIYWASELHSHFLTNKIFVWSSHMNRYSTPAYPIIPNKNQVYWTWTKWSHKKISQTNPLNLSSISSNASMTLLHSISWIYEFSCMKKSWRKMHITDSWIFLHEKILEKDAHNYKDTILGIFPLMNQHKTTSISLEHTKQKSKMSPSLLSNVASYSCSSLILLHHWYH